MVFSRFQGVFQFLVYSNYWVSGVAMLLYFQTQVFQGIPSRWWELVTVFSATCASYSFQRLSISNARNLSTSELWWFQKKQFLRIQVLFFGLLCLLCFPYRWFSFYGLLGICTIVSIFYAWPVPWKGKKVVLRNYPLVKIFLIAFSWAIFTGVLAQDEVYTTASLLVFVDRFLWVFAFTLPFDLRDVEQPMPITIPQVLGPQKVLVVAAFIALLSLFITGYSQEGSNRMPIFIGGIAAILLLAFSRKGRSALFYGLWLEGALLGPLTAYLLWISLK
ncbi:MAG: hypothetical protein ACI9YL_001360 [Luteibaculaceae bacterium]|jgi:hypothetical protein